jgi:hypothetical protein
MSEKENERYELPPSVTLDAEAYNVRTIITYTEQAELKDYLVPADEMTDFYMTMEDPVHGEEIVTIEPVGEPSGELELGDRFDD